MVSSQGKKNCVITTPSSKPSVNTLRNTNPINHLKSSDSANKFTVFHQNIQGLLSKLEELSINILDKDFVNNADVICLSEHFMKLGSDMPQLNNYNLVALYCRHSLERGGVAIYVKNKITYRSLDLSEYCIDQHCEVCGVVICTDFSEITVLSFYRAPAGKISIFLKQLESLLSHLFTKTKDIIILGDFNVNFLIDNMGRNDLSHLMNSFNLTALVDFPTRVTANSVSRIDNIFLDRSRNLNTTVKRILNGLSDHDGQLLTIEGVSPLSKKNSCSKTFRVINTQVINTFCNSLQEVDWDQFELLDNVNEKYNAFLNEFICLFEAAFPKRTAKFKCETG